MTTTHRHDLPQARGELLLTDAGLETMLIFDQGVDLPDFASFPLLGTDEGRVRLRDYYCRFSALARDHGVGVVLETPTWRASADWGARLGYDHAALRALNAAAVDLLREVRTEYQTADVPVVISGNLGPRGDGYVADEAMTPEAAEAYHRHQVTTFADAGADLVTVLTMTYAAEAIGVARAAAAAEIPVVVSFTVETDGRLPTGQPLGEAIKQVDEATDGYPLFFGINCAHPDHFTGALSTGDGWVERIGLLRANASRMSHEELDNAEVLDPGDPVELGDQYADLRHRFPHVVVVGGCCGTDDRHIGEIGRACLGHTTAV